MRDLLQRVNWRRVQIAAGLLAGGTVAALAFVRWLPNVAPEADMALMDIHILNVLQHLEPVGSYSRYRWNHPGPLYSIIQAPLFWLGGYRHLSTSVTAMLVNVAAVAAAGVLMYRWSRNRVLVITAVALVAIYLVRVPALLASPWNPHFPILLLPLLLTGAAAVATGRFAMLPAVVLLASLIVQTHVGFAACVAATVGAAITMSLVSVAAARNDRTTRRAFSRAVVATVVVGLLAWALPLWDALSSTGSHNLQHLYDFFTQESRHRYVRATNAFVYYLIAPASPELALPWGAELRAVEARGMRQVALMQMLLLAGAAAGWVARRRRFEAAWSIILIVSLLASYASIRRLPEVPRSHTVFWVSMLGVMSWTTILALLATLWPARWSYRPSPHPALPTAITAVVATILLAVGSSQVVDRGHADASPRARALTRPIRDELDRVGVRTAVFHVRQSLWPDVAGVVFQLYRNGYQPRVEKDWVWMFGQSLAPTGDERLAFDFTGPDSDASHQPAEGYRSLGSVGLLGVYVRTQDATPVR